MFDCGGPGRPEPLATASDLLILELSSIDVEMSHLCLRTSPTMWTSIPFKYRCSPNPQSPHLQTLFFNLKLYSIALDFSLKLHRSLLSDRLPSDHSTGTQPHPQRTLPALSPHRQTNRLSKPHQQMIDLMPPISRQPRLQHRTRLLRRPRLMPPP